MAGLEVSARWDLGAQSIGLTGAVFGDNDTSGTLLALRGWTLDDVQVGLGGRFLLPPLNDFLERRQSPVTDPVNELDGRPGFYGRADWRPDDRLSLYLFYYDDPGDVKIERRLQWVWRTRFLNLGGCFALDDDTRILSQVMAGDTRMGPLIDNPWVNTAFYAGYLLLTRQLGRDAVTGRIDAFSTFDHADPAYGQTQEHGWALTADYREALSDHISALIELLHVESDRPERMALLGEAPLQRQTALQASLRLSF